MREFTPTIKAVRDAYAYAAHDPSEDDPDSDEHYREFDRWLAQHDAEVRKQVEEEVAQAIERRYLGPDSGRLFDGREAPDAPLRRAYDDGLEVAARTAREIGGAS